jgi:hypothetical protein
MGIMKKGFFLTELGDGDASIIDGVSGNAFSLRMFWVLYIIF